MTGTLHSNKRATNYDGDVTISRCRSRYEADLSVSVRGILYFYLNGIDKIKEITNLRII
jgi:hypothetical protein